MGVAAVAAARCREVAAVKATSARVAAESALVAATPATVEVPATVDVLVAPAAVSVAGWARLAESYAGTTRSSPNPTTLRLGLVTAMFEFQGAAGVPSASAASSDGKLTFKLCRVGDVLTNTSEFGVPAMDDVERGGVTAAAQEVGVAQEGAGVRPTSSLLGEPGEDGPFFVSTEGASTGNRRQAGTEKEGAAARSAVTEMVGAEPSSPVRRQLEESERQHARASGGNTEDARWGWWYK